MEESIRKKKKLRLVGTSASRTKKTAEPEKKQELLTDKASDDELFKEESFDEKKVVRYLLSTVHEVIEVSRRPVPVLDKSGQPTGSVEYQSSTVLKACELMAKLMGTIREDEGKGVSVQIVSYRDSAEESTEKTPPEKGGV